ncbi:uncharacterized protein ColSpa_10268 [Colletotrichum spaethianum]|uniref:Uncharacterized protein n=1 Tax=Colletotrichum spaethianum TaxID=700344 RepID=A0AA37UR44_9PEZI|nr:uncharacterized protein ColSpa_10268 [Colletotrichum spaethianum]GKT50087.1 hypothetical protein ColSpa_10268 [Colletotrichum spaethianum]
MSMLLCPNMNATVDAADDSLLFATMIQRWPVAAIALFTCTVAFLWHAVFKSDPWVTFPLVGAEYGGQESRRKTFMNGEAWNLYLSGYQKVISR